MSTKHKKEPHGSLLCFQFQCSFCLTCSPRTGLENWEIPREAARGFQKEGRPYFMNALSRFSASLEPALANHASLPPKLRASQRQNNHESRRSSFQRFFPMVCALLRFSSLTESRATASPITASLYNTAACNILSVKNIHFDIHGIRLHIRYRT